MRIRELVPAIVVLTLYSTPKPVTAAGPQDEGAGVADGCGPAGDELRWYRGNLHTHSLWSDGNDFPEMIAEWYRHQGYHFLALSDHNVLSSGQRWMARADIVRRGGDTVMPKYLARYGPHWVERRPHPETGAEEVRLKPLEEFRALVEERGRFLLIQGEEITDNFRGIPIHLNATNVLELIPPQGGDGIRATMANNLRAVASQAERTGQPVLPHLNHPNYQWAVTAEDIAEVVEDRFFEVFNGHGSVQNLGDDLHAGTERMWDIANTIRIDRLHAAPLYGLATDDSHQYHAGQSGSIAGIGWIMVLARHLTPESIIRAMEAGDFYASTGVTLRSASFDAAARTVHVSVAPVADASYTIRFIGTSRGYDARAEPVRDDDGNEIRTTMRYSDEVGATLAEVEGTEATYALTGDELYVRAVVTSTRVPDVPTAENRFCKAWTQPVGWK